MKKFTFILAIFLSYSTAFSQGKIVYQEVQSKQNTTEAFISDKIITKYEASSVQKIEKSESPNAIKFIPNVTELRNILKSKSEYLEITIPGIRQKSLTLQLIESEIFAPGFSVTVDDGTKITLLNDFTTSNYYKGVVKGDPSSLVAISIDGSQIRGIINSDMTGELNLGLIPGQTNNEHVLYNVEETDTGKPFSCATIDDGIGYTKEQLEGAIRKDAGDIVDIFIEIDGDLTSALGGVSAADSWIRALFNESATLYSNESINIAISAIEINTSVQYRGNSSSRFLSKFQNAYSGGFNGDLGHLVNNKSSAGGVAAGFSGICNPDPRQSLCYSGLQTTFNSLPTYSWSVMVFTHEMGHLIGSRHTHACVWNGNNTAIDGCAGQTEGTCALPGNPSIGGTIMSYCHITAVGINFNEGFGPQPGNVIRNSIASASCLSGGTGPTCTDGIQNGDEDGVDCGGSCPEACPTPTCTDGIQNQGETGIDCGGPCLPCDNTCDDPTNLSVTGMKNNGGKRADLNWDAVSGANSYDVRIRSVGSSTWTTSNTTSTSIRFTGFSNGVNYEWEVRANCTDSSSNYTGCTFTWTNNGSDNCGNNTGGLVFSSSEDELLVYPNPVSDMLILELINGSPLTYSIILYDTVGKKIKDAQMNDQQSYLEINTSSLENGLYFLSSDNGEKRTVKKIIVHK